MSYAREGDFSVVVLQQRRWLGWLERVVHVERGLTGERALQRAEQLAAACAAGDLGKVG